MTTLRIKTGEEVMIIAGKDKGKKGKILQTFPALNRVVVEGVRLTKRHLKSRQAGQKGQQVEFPMPVHASNVQRIGEDGKPARHRQPTKRV